MAFDKSLVTGFTQISGGLPGFAPAAYSVFYGGDSADFGGVGNSEFDEFMRKKGTDLGDCIFYKCDSGSDPSNMGILFEDGGELTLKIPALVGIN